MTSTGMPWGESVAEGAFGDAQRKADPNEGRKLALERRDHCGRRGGIRAVISEQRLAPQHLEHERLLFCANQGRPEDGRGQHARRERGFRWTSRLPASGG